MEEGTFTCAFTRRDCVHDAIFSDAYQRTNRTRENKILRCFPHCCHGHVPRSYCGSSLHVQVDFHGRAAASASASTSTSTSASTTRTTRQPRADDDVFVFARFRPSGAWTEEVGDRISADSVLSALQSDSDPAGEWIEGVLLASAHQNAWLFEVNRAARWYYCWGSSAATTARNTDHVLEVFVFVHTAEARNSSSSGGDNMLEIVAKTCSPTFKLVSFRRAQAIQANATRPPVDVATKSSAELSSSSGISGISGISGSGKHRRLEPSSRGSASAIAPAMNESAKRKRSAAADTITLSTASTASTASAIRGPLGDLSTVLALAQSVPLAALVDGIAQLNRYYVGVVARTLDAQAARPHRGRWATTIVDADVEHSFTQMLVDMGQPRPLLGGSSLNDMSHELVDVVVDVALWLSLDSVVRADAHHFLSRAAVHISNKPLLLHLHNEWLCQLAARVDAFLASRPQRWSLALLVDEIRHQWTATAIRVPSELDFPAFVAQASQVCVADHRRQQTHPATLKRRLVHTQSSFTLPSTQPYALPSLVDLQLHAGVAAMATTTAAAATTWWYCPLEWITVRPLSSTDPLLRPQSPVAAAALPLLLWFWRQLACISLTPVASSSTPGVHTADPHTLAITIRSILATATTTTQSSSTHTVDSGMTLLLDGRPHWSATLPNGDATLSSHPLGGDLRIGDYTAQMNDATGVLTVHWFAWQLSHTKDGRPPLWTGALCCRLTLTVASDHEMYGITTVERGVLVEGGGGGGDPFVFEETMSGATRLQYIRQWIPQWRAEMRYQPI